MIFSLFLHAFYLPLVFYDIDKINEESLKRKAFDCFARRKIQSSKILARKTGFRVLLSPPKRKQRSKGAYSKGQFLKVNGIGYLPTGKDGKF